MLAIGIATFPSKELFADFREYVASHRNDLLVSRAPLRPMVT